MATKPAAAWRPWLVPLALGLLVAFGGWAWQQAMPAAPVQQEPAAPAPPRFVLAPLPDTPAGPVALLDHAQPATLWRGLYENGTFTAVPKQRCGDVAIPDVDPCSPPVTLHPGAVSRPAEPGLGQDGLWLARATILVFRQDGHLAFGNAPEAVTSLYPKLDFTPLPRGTFYLGNGTPPPDAVAPSGAVAELFAPLRAQLVGLPVGAVASAELDSATVRDLFGMPLYATARIEWLGAAGPAATR